MANLSLDWGLFFTSLRWQIMTGQKRPGGGSYKSTSKTKSRIKAGWLSYGDSHTYPMATGRRR